MLAPDYPIMTERLLLRPVILADAVPMGSYQSRDDVCRYIPYQPRGADVLIERISDPANVRSILESPGQNIWLSVVRRDDGVLVGDVILFWVSEEHRTGEIGYVFDPGHHGNGYATEAAGALMRLGFEGLGLRRMVARLDARNDSSAAVVRRLGMRQEAHLVENEWFKGEWTSELQFAILADEWRTRLR